MRSEFFVALATLAAQSNAFSLFGMDQLVLPQTTTETLDLNLGRFKTEGRSISFYSSPSKNVTTVSKFFAAADSETGYARSESNLVFAKIVGKHPDHSLESILEASKIEDGQDSNADKHPAVITASTVVNNKDSLYFFFGFSDRTIKCKKEPSSVHPSKLEGEFVKFLFDGHRLAKAYKLTKPAGILFEKDAHSHEFSSMSQGEVYAIVDAFDGRLRDFIGFFKGDKGDFGVTVNSFQSLDSLSPSQLTQYITVPKDLDALC